MAGCTSSPSALAERGGVAVTALRLHEAKGLISGGRASGDQRRYPGDTPRRVATRPRPGAGPRHRSPAGDGPVLPPRLGEERFEVVAAAGVLVEDAEGDEAADHALRGRGVGEGRRVDEVGA